MAKDVMCDMLHAAVKATLEGRSATDAIKDVIAMRQNTINGIALLHGSALYQYSQLVKDGAVWDYKDEVGKRLGPGITLCANGICYDDIEYSVVGNLHFAYIGIVAGIPGLEIQAGAAYAEIRDPSHDKKNTKQYTEEYQWPEYWQLIGWTPWDLSTLNFGDEPKDHEAVTVGIKMGRYGATMTRGQFENELARNIGKFARCAPNAFPVREDVAAAWPYRVGYFNNVGDSYQLKPGRCS